MFICLSYLLQFHYGLMVLLCYCQYCCEGLNCAYIFDTTKTILPLGCTFFGNQALYQLHLVKTSSPHLPLYYFDPPIVLISSVVLWSPGIICLQQFSNQPDLRQLLLLWQEPFLQIQLVQAHFGWSLLLLRCFHTS